MAKGKNMNPADAFRKAQRAKELKKNKENRAKARETATLKKDTSGLEKEMHELEDIGEEKLDAAQKARLKELRTEVARIRKVKQDYVNAHPEQSHLVRGLEERHRRPTTDDTAAGSSAPAVRSVFGKNGLPLHPERSIYYDPVLNPYGMPPPGMPYVERPLLPHEIEEERMQSQGVSKDGTPDMDSVMNSGSSDSEEDASDDDDDDVILPSGPPPSDSRAKESDSESSSEDSDDDIPMPSGPPPPKVAPPLPTGPPPTVAPFPPGAPYGTAFPPFPPNVQPFTHAPSHVPPPPPGFPTTMYPGYVPAFTQTAMPYPPQMPGSGRGPRPPRDRQFAEAVQTVQDPLSNVPHVTYQAHQAQRHQLPAPPTATAAGLPPKPGGVPQAASSATIFAEPELRDLKKEATAFVPTSMRRAAKKGANTSTASGLKIDAAPNEAGEDHSGSSAEPRKDLMSVLGSQLGVADKPSTAANNKGQGKDDYEKFLAEVGSFL